MQLVEQQKQVLYQLVSGIREKGLKQQTLGGYAGTGKTTLINYLTQFFPSYGIAAYTGKAANVLRKKGAHGASTIHSRIYKPYFDNHGTMYFDLTDDPGCTGFIIDEASMVSKEIYGDLCSFDLPMLFVGDHGQLEPIGSDFNLMKSPDLVLEEIHRNAGDIAKFAEHVRRGFASRGFRCQDGSVTLTSRVSVDDFLASDQVICAYNKTRVKVNNQVREALGHKGLINVGERVMCLRNNKVLGLFNGMQGTVASLYDGKRGQKYMDLEFDGALFEKIRYDTKQFGQESYDFQHGRDKPNPFDYAYCITAHKAQGDEWGEVLVIEQKCKKWDHKRWAYTAGSRPRTGLKWKLAA
jgi:exodeoxyribonuclease-5